MKFIRHIIIILLSLSSNLFLVAQPDADTLLFTPDFFEIEEPVDITLQFDVTEFREKKDSTKVYPAIIKYYTKDSVEISKNIGIEIRGISRQRFCDFPPFLLKLKKTDIHRDFIADSKKIKVVTLCKSATVFHTYLYKEYLIYKLYNIITDNSFRVRLVNITFIDEGRKNKTLERLLYIIEPEELMAQRQNCVPVKMDELNYRHTEPWSADLMSMFQYMIGNTDFTVNGRHNIKLLKSKDFSQPLLIPVAYDFDFAGLINADYAAPAPVLSIEKVTDRYFLGLCRTDEEYQKVIAYFNDKHQEIIDTINNFEYLSDKEKRRTLKYIEEFYKIMNKDNFIEKELRRTCRK